MFPAYAGMNRLKRQRAEGREQRAMFPAYAGMNRL